MDIREGLIHLDFRGLDLDFGKEWTVGVLCEGNNYEAVYDVTAENEADCRIPLIPGTNMVLTLADAGETSLRQIKVFAPEAKPYTDHGFTAEFSVAAVPAGTWVADATELAPTPVTRADVESGAQIYLQAVNTYQVQVQEIEDALVVLRDPNGATYWFECEFWFMPASQTHDAWHTPIDDLLADCLTYGGLPEGTYTVTYYIGGLDAGSVSFTLEEARPGTDV
jgi:hypothetical protein